MQRSCQNILYNKFFLEFNIKLNENCFKDKIKLANKNKLKFILTGRVSNTSTDKSFGMTDFTTSEFVASKITISAFFILQTANLLRIFILKFLC